MKWFENKLLNHWATGQRMQEKREKKRIIFHICYHIPTIRRARKTRNKFTTTAE